MLNTSPSWQKKHKILIVDDHPIVRRGLKELVDDEPDFEVCGEAGNVSEGLRLAEELHPDIIIVDLSLKESHGIELIETLNSQNKGIKILVYSMHDELLFAERTMRAGASGYVSKKELPEKIIEAMRQILEGSIYLSPKAVTRLPRQVQSIPATDHDPIQKLSNRELTVFELLGQGFSMKQIANRLRLSPKTVETYRENIKIKLRLHNSSELSRYATRWILEHG